MNNIQRLQTLGQSIWLDYIERRLIESGELRRLIYDQGISGVTSNPSIFDKAICGASEYDEDLRRHLDDLDGTSTEQLFFKLAIEDIQAAADLLKPVYETSRYQDGMVSLEVSPALAHDAAATIEQARQLSAQVNRRNLMIKVPATMAGLTAIENLTAEGINVNATLLFSISRYREVAESYLSGIEARLRRGQEVGHIASVASFFVSRVDTAVDKLLQEKINGGDNDHLTELSGQAAIANATLAYEAGQLIFSSERFQKLRESGATAQRLLWASTGTKNPQYSDVMYVDKLVGAGTVNTMPPATIDAFLDHGQATITLDGKAGQAREVITSLYDAGINLNDVTDKLEQEGVQQFSDAFQHLLANLDSKIMAIKQGRQARG